MTYKHTQTSLEYSTKASASDILHLKFQIPREQHPNTNQEVRVQFDEVIAIFQDGEGVGDEKGDGGKGQKTGQGRTPSEVGKRRGLRTRRRRRNAEDSGVCDCVKF